jgi:hypothetical protein
MQSGVEVGASCVYFDLDKNWIDYKHIMFVTSIIMNGIVGSAHKHMGRPQVFSYQLDHLEKSSAKMEEYTKKHPLRTKPHVVAQTGEKRSINTDQVLHRITIVPHGFWEEQFADAP